MAPPIPLTIFPGIIQLARSPFYDTYNPPRQVICKCPPLIIPKLVEVGELKPDEIHMPGIFVDRIVQAKGLEKRIERLMLN